MKELITDITEIDQQIFGLSDSNNRKVENISQLSAATEEVTASAEQVSELSKKISPVQRRLKVQGVLFGKSG